MTELTQDLSLAQVCSLIDSYAFDLDGYDIEQLLQSWLATFNTSWIRLATIEALYLGRYKAVSIEHILNVWLRLGVPNTHFTYEFERLICRKLPKHLSNLTDKTSSEDRIKIDEVNFDPLFSSFHQEKNTQQPLPSTTSPVFIEQTNPKELAEQDTLGLEKAFKQPDKDENSISLISALGLSYNANWSELTIGSKAIHQFIPLPDVSSFFNKLKTFGEESLEG